MSIVGDIFDGITGKTAQEASQRAAETQAGYQMEALDYLKQANAPLQEAQQFGLGALMDFYGGDQQGMIDQVQQSPFYNSMIQQGEEAVLRNAAATGGLRGGNVQQALAQNSQNVLQGLVGQQLGGLGGLAGTSTNVNNIAGMTSGIGQTYAQGDIAGAQARQQGLGNIMSLGGSLVGGLFGG